MPSIVFSSKSLKMALEQVAFDDLAHAARAAAGGGRGVTVCRLDDGRLIVLLGLAGAVDLLEGQGQDTTEPASSAEKAREALKSLTEATLAMYPHGRVDLDPVTKMRFDACEDVIYHLHEIGKTLPIAARLAGGAS